jgi:hypothetical protein
MNSEYQAQTVAKTAVLEPLLSSNSQFILESLRPSTHSDIVLKIALNGSGT